MMSLRRKFTFPERQLKECREHLVLMQTETGATLMHCGHLCFVAASFPSRNQGVGRHGAQMWSSAPACGHGARARCSAVRWGHGACLWCLATVRGLGAWLWCSARCVNTVLVVVCWCSAAVRGLGAQPGGCERTVWSRCYGCGTQCVNMVLGCGAQPGRGMWCSVVVLRAGVHAWHAGTVLAQTVLGHQARCSDVVPQSRCSNRVHGHSAWARCVDVVLRNSCSGVVLAHRSPTLCLNVVLRRGLWVDVVRGARSWGSLGAHALHKDLVLTLRVRPRCLDPVHPDTVLVPPGPGAPFPPWNSGLWLRGAVAGDSWASRFSHLFISFPPPHFSTVGLFFFWGFHWCYFFPLGSHQLMGAAAPPRPQTKANTSTPHPAATKAAKPGGESFRNQGSFGSAVCFFLILTI